MSFPSQDVREKLKGQAMKLGHPAGYGANLALQGLPNATSAAGSAGRGPGRGGYKGGLAGSGFSKPAWGDFHMGPGREALRPHNSPRRSAETHPLRSPDQDARAWPGRGYGNGDSAEEQRHIKPEPRVCRVPSAAAPDCHAEFSGERRRELRQDSGLDAGPYERNTGSPEPADCRGPGGGKGGSDPSQGRSWAPFGRSQSKSRDKEELFVLRDSSFSSEDDQEVPAPSRSPVGLDRAVGAGRRPGTQAKPSHREERNSLGPGTAIRPPEPLALGPSKPAQKPPPASSPVLSDLVRWTRPLGGQARPDQGALGDRQLNGGEFQQPQGSEDGGVPAAAAHADVALLPTQDSTEFPRASGGAEAALGSPREHSTPAVDSKSAAVALASGVKCVSGGVRTGGDGSPRAAVGPVLQESPPSGLNRTDLGLLA